MDRDLVHRQTAAVTVKHLALGCAGLGCEDAIMHLLNYCWPNVFETSPHLINAVHEAIEGGVYAVRTPLSFIETRQTASTSKHVSSLCGGTPVGRAPKPGARICAGIHAAGAVPSGAQGAFRSRYQLTATFVHQYTFASSS